MSIPSYGKDSGVSGAYSGNSGNSSEIDTRQMKQIEELTDSVSKRMIGHFETQQKVGEWVEKRVLTEKGIQDLYDQMTKMESLDDMIRTLMNLQTMLRAARIAIFSKESSFNQDKQMEEVENKAAEQRSKKTALWPIVGGILSIGGAFLGAFDATGGTPALMSGLIPKFLANGQVIGSVGTATTNFGQVVGAFSQSQQTLLDAQLQRTGSLLNELRMAKEQENSLKQQELQKPSEYIREEHQAKSSVISVQG